MSIRPDPTPNPNAMKFTVGEPLGGPQTHTADTDSDDPTVAALLALDGVTSIFMTADFITLTKSPDADWDSITPSATEILETRFG